MKKGSKALSVEEFDNIMNSKKPIVLDVRKPQEFAGGHIPDSLYIGLDGQFAPWVGTLIIDINAPMLLITPEGREEETVMRLSRVGYDNCIGYLKGGISSWKKCRKRNGTDQKSIPAEEFIGQYKAGYTTLDVRKPGEFESAHLKNAVSEPLDFVFDWVDTIDKSHPYMIHCAGGYRSMIAASI